VAGDDLDGDLKGLSRLPRQRQGHLLSGW
jgi:hypothetical protein